MSERRHFVTTIRIAPKSDVIVLLTCYVLTVVFDMVIAVSVGIVLASLLFMKRSAELTHSRLLQERTSELEFELPPGVAVYEVAGPLFFGAAQNAMGALENVGSNSRVVLLALGRVPSIDATGLVALESALSRLRAAKKLVVLSGPLPEPRGVFDRAGLADHHDHLHFADTFNTGLALARNLASQNS
jgi:SulP family sulfate permease